MVSSFGSSVAVTRRYSWKVVVTGRAGLVIAHEFVERVADAMDDAAMDLALDDHRIDHAAGIVQRHIALQRDMAEFGLDLDLERHGRHWHRRSASVSPLHASLRARAPARREGVAGCAAQHPRESRRGRCCGCRRLTRTWPSLELELVLRHLAGWTLAALRWPFRRPILRRGGPRGARGDELATGEAAEPERRAARYRRRSPSTSLGRSTASSLGTDLGERGGEALPHRGGAGEDADLAVLADAHHAALERPAAGALHRIGDADADIAALAERRASGVRENRPSRPRPAPRAWEAG